MNKETYGLELVRFFTEAYWLPRLLSIAVYCSTMVKCVTNDNKIKNCHSCSWMLCGLFLFDGISLYREVLYRDAFFHRSWLDKLKRLYRILSITPMLVHYDAQHLLRKHYTKVHKVFTLFRKWHFLLNSPEDYWIWYYMHVLPVKSSLNSVCYRFNMYCFYLHCACSDDWIWFMFMCRWGF